VRLEWGGTRVPGVGDGLGPACSGEPFGRDPGILQAIRTWRDGLVNLTASNRLLNFKPTKSSTLAIARPGPQEVLARINTGKGYRFRALRPPEKSDTGSDAETVPFTPPAPSSECLDADKVSADLGRIIRNLYRRSTQAYIDQGLSVLYLAFGMLDWTDEDRTKYTSPLLLVPVRLVTTGTKDLPGLEPTDDDTVVNPVLALKLGELGITLPSADIVEDGTLEDFLNAVRRATAAAGQWMVRNDLTLSCFSFNKEAMYRDLLENEDRIAKHEAVAALAVGGSSLGGDGDGISDRFAFDEIPDSEMDREAPTETAPTILDADSSQRACIAAATAGKSFVMDGPPGTGKSQTIANIIGALLHKGRTVLFVSEKAAALDVVRNRLAKVGLDPYLLELHSAKATRKEVAEELGKALTTELVPPDPLGLFAEQSARERREQLNAYADAMNRTRDPLGYSLHYVLGRIALLHGVPVAPLAGMSMADLTVEKYGEVIAAARTIAAAWRPAQQGATFIWRGVVQQGSLEALLYQASSALATLHGTVGLNAALTEPTGLTRPSDASALAILLDHQSARPRAFPDNWLYADSLTDVRDAIGKLDSCLSEIATAEREASLAAAVAWQLIPQPRTLDAVPDLSGIFPPTPDVTGLRSDEIARFAEIFKSRAETIARRSASLATLAGIVGVETPVTFAAADDLLSVALLAEAPHLPERVWLTPAGLAAATSAADILKAACRSLAEAESAASAYYTRQVLREDAEGLAVRAAAHHGLGKLSGEYRSDKKVVASFTADGVSKDAAHQYLGLAVAWKQAVSAFAAAEDAHGRALGAYYDGRSTDFSAVAAALEVAATALRLMRGQEMHRLAEYLARDGSRLGETAVLDMARGINMDLRTWRSDSTTPPELLGSEIDVAVRWMYSQAEFLHATSATTNAVSAAVGRPLTAGIAVHLLRLRTRADVAHDQLAAFAGEFADAFGSLYDDSRSDITAIRQAFDWACRMRELVAGNVDSPLTDPQVKALEIAHATPALAAAAATWQAVRSSLLEAFGPERRDTMSAELDDYEDAEDLIKSLRDDSAGQDEWHTYRKARSLLESRGLSAAVAFCVTDRVPAQLVTDVIERALLQEWAEHVIRTDPALEKLRATDRDALVAGYRELDKKLISAAVGDIIRACNSRRPRTDVGESGTIRHEASKKRKHMPVRRLLESTRNVTQAIKPCFMMSPLTVSQFLPPDMRFDVVIFDEASQVLPGDAVNCVYRGSSLILAGDEKQLPPTSWLFGGTRANDDEEWSEDSDDVEDFESVLQSAKGAGVFRNLPLRWHRRSRHESLIAFSNHTFYGGDIITFPGARSDGPDVGVELFHVDGVYRRGTSRDNPIEAAKVAERVIHHYDTRPEMSLGVVAFSEAQANAIEAAVTEARQSRADLDRFFGSNDRLNGYFVKNLEAIQGDERDVLIFSIGYGPDEAGKITMNFGPLNKPGGWRRLNVAITRAHYRNEIVSSIRASDIRADVGSEGVRHLRGYLDFAQRGMAALALDTSTGGDAESPFEESVINVIRSWGYEVTPQVGTAGYRIDIGVRHPVHAGAYALGVECDGYQYHSSRVARDRDRLREDVLKGLGWRLHRIWGTAWYRDRNGAETALRAAIEKAIAAPVDGLLSSIGEDIDGTDSAYPVIGTKEAIYDETPAWVTAYKVALVTKLPSWVDPSGLGNGHFMDGAIKAVVAAEGPVHMDILNKRLREAWDIGRIGRNIRLNIDVAILKARVRRDGDFLLDPEAAVYVRAPTDLCQRSVSQVHGSELDLALIQIARDAGGIGEEDLTVRTARIYGWERRGPDITAALRERIASLLDRGLFTGTPDNLTVVQQQK
jgi:very-short-patch-repair endonuclease